MSPPGPLRNRTWSGTQNSPALWDQAGAYAGNGWSVELPQSAGNDQKAFAASIQGSGVQLHGLTAKHGFQCFKIHHPAGRMISDILLDRCHALNAGVPGSPGGSGGQGFLGDHLTRVTLQDCTCIDPAGHGLYLAETIQTARLIRLNLSGKGEHSPLFQLNSEDGAGIFDVIVQDSIFEVRDVSMPVGNFLGVGKPDQPVLVKGCHFRGGTPLSVHVDKAPGTNRPSYVTFQDTEIEHTLYVFEGSVVWLVGTSKSVRTTGPGKTVRA